jgi:hypothetical protein
LPYNVTHLTVKTTVGLDCCLVNATPGNSNPNKNKALQSVLLAADELAYRF